MLHITLVDIHPFEDGNGRTARLLMNLSLLRDGYGVAIIPPILRSDYIDALKAAQRDKNANCSTIGALPSNSFIDPIKTPLTKYNGKMINIGTEPTSTAATFSENDVVFTYKDQFRFMRVNCIERLNN